MPLTEEQKKEFDKDVFGTLRGRLRGLSHAEIEDAIAKTIESLVGGHYRVHISKWDDVKSTFSPRSEAIDMVINIEAYDPDVIKRLLEPA